MTEAEEKRMANLENLTVALLEFCQTLQARVEATG